MRNQLKTIIITLLFIFVAMSSCSKDNLDQEDALKQLYKTYKNGHISECMYNGQKVYSAGINAYDAGSAIYDKDGNQIADCNFAWGIPDEMCKKLEGCEEIYCIKDNIWGHPPIDKYNLD